jgi:predicted dithiol-disulfide oxidoreductase (DUF899 family)
MPETRKAGTDARSTDDFSAAGRSVQVTTSSCVEVGMDLPEIVSREEWGLARAELLAREKELTRRRDALNADRRRLPMVSVGKPYVFDGPEGEVRLLDLFGELRQLIVQHFMFASDWVEGCPGCTAAVDELAPATLAHLQARDTAFVLISRAPLATLEGYRRRRGWTVPWYSSGRSDFNDDFGATVDGSELPGVSCFLRDDDRVFHTYTTSARGTEYLGGAYTFLDLTALGRQEDWEEPRGRVTAPYPADPAFSDAPGSSA